MTTTDTPNTNTGTSTKSFAFRAGYQTGWSAVQFGLVDTMFAASPRGGEGTNTDPEDFVTEYRNGYEAGYEGAQKMGYIPEYEYASHRVRSANLIGQPITNPDIENVLSKWASQR